MDELRLLSARIKGNSLVAGECASLVGALPDAEGVVVCRSLELVPQSAYLNIGLHCMAEARTLDELAKQIAGMSFPAERFKVELLRVSPASPQREPPVVMAVANAIQAYPDLRTPLHRFLVVAASDCLWFGEIIHECTHSYTRHNRKPCYTSSSLPSRLARAIVNLVFPNSRSILDPFCGTGSLLLEAQLLGLKANGIDLNLNMIEMTRKNLEYFGYTAQVEHANAMDCTLNVDAIVSDLPYGRSNKEIDKATLFAILCQLVPLAPQAVYVAGENLSPELVQAGYRQVQVFDVYKRPGMSRYVHWAKHE